MCEHCGCRGVPPVAELMDEHLALLDEAHHVRAALAAGDRPAALRALEGLLHHLGRHVRREETGIFAALRDDGEFVDEVDALEAEHRGFDAAVAALDDAGDSLERAVLGLLRDLDDHVERGTSASSRSPSSPSAQPAGAGSPAPTMRSPPSSPASRPERERALPSAPSSVRGHSRQLSGARGGDPGVLSGPGAARIARSWPWEWMGSPGHGPETSPDRRLAGGGSPLNRGGRGV